MTTAARGPGYVHGHAEPVRRSHGRRTVANSAAFLRPHLRPGLSLLDVGCGVGTLTADLAAHVAPGRVVGVDSSAEVLHAAREAADARGAAVELRTADAHALPFADGEFDVVHAHQVLQHLPDPVAALREVRRVCRPGGTVAVRDADYATVHWYPQTPGLTAWLSGYRAAARASGGDPDAGSRLLGWARAAGFSEVLPSASVWVFATPDERAWWGGTWAQRTETAPLADRLRGGGFSDGDVASAAQAWREWAAEPDGWTTMVHGELLCRP
ncbi:methyltransferase domain-containing protein [Paenibacillus sp. TRM 82003]|uniref:methyltransferase domain-containing protein n=1 Tax=Kineococcus sp. TRM81007 TaxID=2925831 RepID=UPI001F5910FB|nr:methyltransferase domain-containing protein [Kineococcus sp. TRM81007]MCI2239279.1 methyltransferase domain-containing protein [Kineococcus sp. TRM81007]MCI3924963.1 methyltransferase domain-containing protein [Paenibacillus sp. TRM 82003]